MRKFKVALAGLAIAGLMVSAPAAYAQEADPVGDAVAGVGCAVVTIVTLPIAILSGRAPGC